MADRLILAAAELAEGQPAFTAEELVVAAWRRFPETFGLRGFLDSHGRPLYPDSNRVFAEVMGRMPVRKRGWLEKIGNKRYSVTRAGHMRAQELGEGTSAHKAALDRRASDEVERLMNARALDKWRTGRGDELTFFDACSLWGITPRSNSKDLIARLTAFDDLVGTINGVAEAEDFVLRHGSRSYTSEQVSDLHTLSKELQRRFQPELDIIRSRTTER